MPWSSDRIPKYRLHRATKQAVVTLNGRDYYLGPHGTKASKLEYDRIVTEYLSSGRSSAYGAPAHGLTVVELLADYLQFAAVYYGKDQRGEYPQIMRAIRPLKELYGRTPAVEFGVLEFKAVRQRVSTANRSRGYVNEIMKRIVRVFKWAAAEGQIPGSVPQNLAIIPGLRRGKCSLREPDPVLPVEDSVVNATLPRLPEIVADMVRLQRCTGMRPAEACILRPCDLDCSGEVWAYRPSRHKTEHHGKDRVILMGPRAQGVLLRYLARPATTQRIWHWWLIYELPAVGQLRLGAARLYNRLHGRRYKDIVED